ncbi:hypothetical protein GA0070619_3620 [Micromonospora zamorensis]|nr:hypothetical protein GA0070619_3620 [Micromonospora zamorensis]
MLGAVPAAAVLTAQADSQMILKISHSEGHWRHGWCVLSLLIFPLFWSFHER